MDYPAKLEFNQGPYKIFILLKLKQFLSYVAGIKSTEALFDLSAHLKFGKLGSLTLLCF
jgi:hypothetical protein